MTSLEQKKGRLSFAQVHMLEVAGPIILQQLVGVPSDTVLSDLQNVGVSPIEAVEAMFGIHPKQILPEEQERERL